MNETQIWQTIALDLKRAANYLYLGREKQAKFYLNEAENLFCKQELKDKIKRIERFIRFEGNPEDILLGSSLIKGRI